MDLDDEALFDIVSSQTKEGGKQRAAAEVAYGKAQDAMRTLAARGVALEVIAKAAGVTRQRVHQIVIKAQWDQS